MELITLKDTFDEDGLVFTKVEKLFFHPQGGGQPNDRLVDKHSNPVVIKKLMAIFIWGSIHHLSKMEEPRLSLMKNLTGYVLGYIVLGT